jgi:hypothetical protein
MRRKHRKRYRPFLTDRDDKVAAVLYRESTRPIYVSGSLEQLNQSLEETTHIHKALITYLKKAGFKRSKKPDGSGVGWWKWEG